MTVQARRMVSPAPSAHLPDSGSVRAEPHRPAELHYCRHSRRHQQEPAAQRREIGCAFRQRHAPGVARIQNPVEAGDQQRDRVYGRHAGLGSHVGRDLVCHRHGILYVADSFEEACPREPCNGHARGHHGAGRHGAADRAHTRQAGSDTGRGRGGTRPSRSYGNWRVPVYGGTASTPSGRFSTALSGAVEQPQQSDAQCDDKGNPPEVLSAADTVHEPQQCHTRDPPPAPAGSHEFRGGERDPGKIAQEQHIHGVFEHDQHVRRPGPGQAGKKRSRSRDAEVDPGKCVRPQRGPCVMEKERDQHEHHAGAGHVFCVRQRVERPHDRVEQNR